MKLIVCVFVWWVSILSNASIYEETRSQCQDVFVNHFSILIFQKIFLRWSPLLNLELEVLD